jgi:hypothetical protein
MPHIINYVGGVTRVRCASTRYQRRQPGRSIMSACQWSSTLLLELPVEGPTPDVSWEQVTNIISKK